MKKHQIAALALFFCGVGYLLGTHASPENSPYWLWRKAVTKTRNTFGSSVSSATKDTRSSRSAREEQSEPAAEAEPDRISRASRYLADCDWEKLERLLTRWVSEDPYGALEWANGLSGNRRTGATRTILYTWLKKDPDVAFKWAVDFEPEIIQTDRFYTSVAEAGRYDLGGAAINRLNFKIFALGALVGSWAERDRVSAQDYTVQLKNVGDPNWICAAAAVAKKWAGEDIKSAGAWLDQLGASRGDLRYAYEDLARGALAHGNVEEVLDWVTNAQPSYALNGPYSALAEYYMKSDPDQAVYWLNAIGNADLRGLSYNAIGQLEYTRPAQVALMLEQLTEAPIRDKRIGILVNRWAKQDSAAAYVFVSGTKALSPAARTSLLTKISATMGGGG